LYADDDLVGILLSPDVGDLGLGLTEVLFFTALTGFGEVGLAVTVLATFTLGAAGSFLAALALGLLAGAVCCAGDSGLSTIAASLKIDQYALCYAA
jgi:hypothetical protein